MPRPTDDPPRPRSHFEPAPTAPSVPSRGSAPGPADDHNLPLSHESHRAVLSSRELAGRWEPSDQIEVRAVLGEITLDFTRATLPASGVVEIDAFVFCGEVKIVLPDGADVEVEGTPVLGSIEQKVRKKGPGERIRDWATGEGGADRAAPLDGEEPPFFRIDGRAIMGKIRVTGR